MKVCLVVLAGAVCMAVGMAVPDGNELSKRSSSGIGIGLGPWKLPFGRLSFLTARQDDDDQGVISSAHLLPDYLTHQEFLKPQLEAAGFSGGRIIAGPFPVPLSKLPKPPVRSSAAAEAAVTGVPAPVTIPAPTAPKVTKSVASKGTANVKSQLKLIQRPLAALSAVAGRPAPSQPVRAGPPPAAPSSSSSAKLTYSIPPSAARQPSWLAAYQSGPERPLSSLGSVKYSLPAQDPAVGSASASGDVRVSYGGWTPIFSPVASHLAPQLAQQQGQQQAPAAAARRPAAESPSSASLDNADLENIHYGDVFGDLGTGVNDLIAASDDASFVARAAQPVSEANESVPVLALTPEVTIASALPSASSAPVTHKRTVRGLHKPEQVGVSGGATTLSPPPAHSSAGDENSSNRGRGQGRYVGHALPASVSEDVVAD